MKMIWMQKNRVYSVIESFGQAMNEGSIISISQISFDLVLSISGKSRADFSLKKTIDPETVRNSSQI
jgi:hypothetical protein